MLAHVFSCSVIDLDGVGIEDDVIACLGLSLMTIIVVKRTLIFTDSGLGAFLIKSAKGVRGS